MTTIRNMRTGAGIMALAALMLILSLQLTGCSDDTNSLTGTPQATAPTLPDAQALTFDFNFFDSGESMDKSSGIHENFVNAYLRAVVLEALAELTLAGPVGAFAAALHTDPVALDDGSWDWTYTWTERSELLRIRLNGKPVDGHVAWEMHVSGDGDVTEFLWFTGETSDGGDTGRWSFYDLDRAERPVCGEISWGDADNGRYLQFMSYEDESDGATLRFTDADPDFRIEFTPGDGTADSFISWHADGSGSLQVPDYNDGRESCWDVWQENVVCAK